MNLELMKKVNKISLTTPDGTKHEIKDFNTKGVCAAYCEFCKSNHSFELHANFKWIETVANDLICIFDLNEGSFTKALQTA